jgi:ribulose bisphosphate carboxylase small subunit
MAQQAPPVQQVERDVFYGGGFIKFNTLFGQVKFKEGREGDLYDVKVNKDSTRDFIARELGIYRKIFNIERTKNALLNPTRFFTEKQNDYVRINNLAAKRFRDTYKLLIERGLKNSEAESGALKAAKEVYTNEMVIHKEQFPKDVTKTIIEKNINK